MARPKKTVADQPQIPGTETPKNEKVHRAAIRYAELGRPHDQERCLARSRAPRQVQALT